MTSFFAEYAWLPGPGESPRLVRGVRLTVGADGAWKSVIEDAHQESSDTVVGGVSFPGLANTHSHAFHRGLRGRTHSGAGGSFWTWREQMYRLADRLDPDTYFELARAVYAEMVVAGMTAVGEFHYVHHPVGGGRYDDPNAMSAALMHAAEEAGIRLTLLDVLYLAGGFASEAELNAQQLRFSDGSVDKWLERQGAREPADGVILGAAIHSVRAVSPEDLRYLSKVRPSGPLHVHLSEQKKENHDCREATGFTPTALLSECGLLDERLTAVHATHLTDEDISLLGRNGCGISFCPTTERDLADGVGPARALVDAGACMSVGSDQHAIIDEFEELRALEMHERLTTAERGHFSPAELTRFGSVNGYRLLGHASSGFAPGVPADLVAISLDSINTAGSEPSEAVFSATPIDVHTVVVGGTEQVRHGRHLRIDAARSYADIFAKLWR